MSFTLKGSNTAFDGTSGSTIAAAVASVAVGDVVCVYAYNDTTSGTPTCSDGTTTLTPGTYIANTTVFGRMFRLDSSAVAGTVTYTVTFTGAVTGRGIAVYVFTPVGGAGALDTETAASGFSTAPDSGNITTTGLDELVFGADTTEQGSSTFLINGLAATGVLTPNAGGHLWYLAFASTFTGSASSTEPGSGRYACHIGAFKIASAAVSMPIMGQVCL